MNDGLSIVVVISYLEVIKGENFRLKSHILFYFTSVIVITLEMNKIFLLVILVIVSIGSTKCQSFMEIFTKDKVISKYAYCGRYSMNHMVSRKLTSLIFKNSRL